LIAVTLMYFLLRSGFAIVGAFARPVPEPPPPGELRRVKLTYRCNECGAELRMTLANDEVPNPPRHCTEEMELTATREDGL
jgi:DNA-directed RNA polymerase subunit RPC12/RpoP